MINKALTSAIGITVLLLLTQTQAALDVIGGASKIMSTFSILDPDNRPGYQIMDFNFSNVSPTKDFLIADDLQYTQYINCNFEPKVYTPSTLPNRIFGNYSKLQYVENDNYLWITDQQTTWNRTVFISEIKCTLHTLQYVGSGKTKLSNWFTTQINNLPSTVDETNMHDYIRFFSTFGDHVLTKCEIGGKINQIVAVNNSYLVDKDLEEVREEVKKVLMKEIDQIHYKKYNIDEDFLNNSIARPIFSTGGILPLAQDSWQQWTSSIYSKQNLACVQWEAVPITDLQTLDKDLTKKKSTMEVALQIYLNYPSCNHIKLERVRPIGTIMKLSDVYQCQDEAQGAWYLVQGPDDQNRCILSFAIINGDGRQKLGQTQYERSDFNKFNTDLHGIMVQDTMNCTQRSGNATFLLKDPSNRKHFVVLDPSISRIDDPMKFTIRSNDKNAGMGETLTDGRNLCKNPYCTKLVTDWTPYQTNVTTLAWVAIDKKFFDPTWDPDFNDYYNKGPYHPWDATNCN